MFLPCKFSCIKGSFIILNIELYFPAPRIPLDGPCSTGEFCLDENSECVQGVCKCKPGFWPGDGECGKDFIQHQLTQIASAKPRKHSSHMD